MNIGESIKYNYTGSVQTVSLTPGIYKIECYGASGGNGNGGQAAYAGLGGYTSGMLEIFETCEFHIYVGGAGKYATVCKGGWNGGGSADNVRSGSGSGGGATDIRLVSGNWNDTTSLRSRIMVAGAGGGGGRYAAKGGNGGGLNGGNGEGATGGTQTTGGTSNGKFGIGGNGPTTNNGKGCGGGGYYGGGTNATGNSYYHSGGGGSSFISGMEGCNAIDENGKHTGQPIHYSGLFFTDCETQSGVNRGNGYAIITYINNGTIYNITVDDNIICDRAEAYCNELITASWIKKTGHRISKWLLNPKVEYTQDKYSITFLMPKSDIHISILLELNRLNSNIYKNIFPETATDISHINSITNDISMNIDITQENHGLELYDIVYLDSDNKYKKALADNTIKSKVEGIVVNVSNDNIFTLTNTGKIKYKHLDYNDTSILYLSDKEPGKLVHYTEISNTVYIPIGIYTGDSVIVNIQQGSIGTVLAPYTNESSNCELYSMTELDDTINQILSEVWYEK